MARRATAKKATNKSKRQTVASYPYRDESGKLVYQLVRYNPKDFAFQKPGGRPLPFAGRRHLLYRLPELLAAPATRTVFVVEGEKDVDRLWSVGLVATCNEGGGGKGKWFSAHSKPLKGRSVGIIPDNDKTGEQHAEDVARRLLKYAAAIKIVRLAGLPHKGDVSVWLDAGGTAAELEQLFVQAKPWQPSLKYEILHNENALWDQSHHREQIIASNLSAPEKLLLIILGESRDTSQDALAHYMSLTKRRLRQIMDKLKRLGVVRVLKIRRRNSYSVNLPSLAR
jgi:DNA primase